ncbi:MAG: hypothetical protein IJ439_02715 [Tyzzerella sp.]|nr:hypothetical protein [Tyzzerella sp.]
MQKRSGIGFLILTIVIVFVFIFVYKVSYQKALSDNEEQNKEEKVGLEDYFYIKATDGYVTVYLADQETVYEYTSIPVSELPEDVQEELKNGKKVTNIGQVYGFLENYSS